MWFEGKGAIQDDGEVSDQRGGCECVTIMLSVKSSEEGFGTNDYNLQFIAVAYVEVAVEVWEE